MLRLKFMQQSKSDAASKSPLQVGSKWVLHLAVLDDALQLVQHLLATNASFLIIVSFL